jgi:hypothetical protein
MNTEWMLDVENLPWVLLAGILWLSSFGDLVGRLSNKVSKDQENFKPYQSGFPVLLVLAAFTGSSIYLTAFWKASVERDERYEQQAVLIGKSSPDHEWAIQTFRSCAGNSVNCAASTLSLARENQRDIDRVKDALLRWGEFTGKPMGIDAPHGSVRPGEQ